MWGCCWKWRIGGPSPLAFHMGDQGTYSNTRAAWWCREFRVHCHTRGPAPHFKLPRQSGYAPRLLYISLRLSVWPEEVKLTLDDPAEGNGWGESPGKGSPAWDRRNFSQLTCSVCCHERASAGSKRIRHLCFHAHGSVHQWISHINTAEGCRRAQYSVTAGCLGFSSIAEMKREQTLNSSCNDT